MYAHARPRTHAPAPCSFLGTHTDYGTPTPIEAPTLIHTRQRHETAQRPSGPPALIRAPGARRCAPAPARPGSGGGVSGARCPVPVAGRSGARSDGVRGVPTRRGRLIGARAWAGA